MIAKSDIITAAKALVHHQQGLRKQKVIHPYRDWFIGLIGLLLVSIFGGSVAVWGYLSYADLSDVQGIAATSLPSFDDVAASEALTQFAARETQFQTLTNSYAVYVGVAPTATSSDEAILPQAPAEQAANQNQSSSELATTTSNEITAPTEGT